MVSRHATELSPVMDLRVGYVSAEVVGVSQVKIWVAKLVQADHVDLKASVMVVIKFVQQEDDRVSVAGCAPSPNFVVQSFLKDLIASDPDLKAVLLATGVLFTDVLVLDFDQDGAEVQILILVRHLHDLLQSMQRNIF